jgi:hypothetical protein
MPKTVIDLRLQFKKETGNYPPPVTPSEDMKPFDYLREWKEEMELYIEWLEQVALTHINK